MDKSGFEAFGLSACDRQISLSELLQEDYKKCSEMFPIPMSSSILLMM